MTGALSSLLLPPDMPPGWCGEGRHQVNGPDHAKPIPTPGDVVYVCVFCWQEAEVEFMRTSRVRPSTIAHRQVRHRQERAALIVDDVAIDRVAAGDASYRILTPREAHLLIPRMVRAGVGGDEIRRRTGMNPRVVDRRRGAVWCPALKTWEQRMLTTMLTEPAAMAAA